MSAGGLGPIVVIRDAGSKEALAGITAALAAPETAVLVITSELSDLIPRPPQVLAGGNRDLKLVAAEEDGDDPRVALSAAMERAARPELVVLGPGAAAPSEDSAGSVLVLSALGSAAPGLVADLPDVGLHFDVGGDACEGLIALVTALEAEPAAHLRAACLLGLDPSDEALHALLALAGRLPTVVWDPEPTRVAAWQSHGLAATTSLGTVAAALRRLNTPAGETTPTLISTSERLAALTARCLGLTAEAEFEPTLRAALGSELPQHVALRAPLVIPEAPVAPNLPPRHRRQIAAAASLLQEAGHSVLIALSDTDPALGSLQSDAASRPGVQCTTLKGLVDLAAGRDLAAVARARVDRPSVAAASPFEFNTQELERLQTIALAALVMRQSSVNGAPALTIASAMTGLKSAPRVLAMSAGHAASLAAKSPAVFVGLEVAPAGRRQAPKAPPLPRLCRSSAEAETAFDDLIDPESAALAYEARYVAPVAEGSTLVILTITHRPVAATFRFESHGRRPVDGLLPSAAETPIPASFHPILARSATLMRDLNVLGELRVVFAQSPHEAPAMIVDAFIRLSNQGFSPVRG